MDKNIEKRLDEFEKACYRKAFAGSMHPIDAELIKIAFKEIKFQLHVSIGELEAELEKALEKIDEMVEAERYHEETKGL